MPKLNNAILNRIFTQAHLPLTGPSRLEVLERTLKQTRNRKHVVSSKLCSHVLHRLASSLRPHAGCDIVDLNPGLGVWSRALHDHLKPRRHLLVEKQQQTFQPFLSDLLGKETSKTQFVNDVDPDKPSEYHRLLSYLPEQTVPAHPWTLENQHNPSLLITGSLQSPSPTAEKRDPGLAALYYFASAIQTHQALNKYGLVRILLWLQSDKQRDRLLKPLVFLRDRFHLDFDRSFDSIEEVAGTPLAPREEAFYTRLWPVEVASMERVQEKMHKAKGLATQPARDLRLTKGPELDIRDIDGEELAAFRFLNEYNLPMTPQDKDYVKLLNRYVRNKFTALKGGELFKDANERDQPSLRNLSFEPLKDSPLERTPEYRQMLKYRQSIDFRASRHRKAEQSADHALKLFEGEEESDRGARSEWKQAVARQSHDQQRKIALFTDEKSAFYREKPLFFWDRREAEPFLIGEEEVYQPGSPQFLVDMRPRAQPAAQDDKQWKDGYDPYELLSQELMHHRGSSVGQALDKIYPGAAAALIPKVPALTDPRQGGKREVEQLRVRLLTYELMRDLAEAWKRWLFRPSTREMLMRMGDDNDYVDRQQTSGRNG